MLENKTRPEASLNRQVNSRHVPTEKVAVAEIGLRSTEDRTMTNATTLPDTCRARPYPNQGIAFTTSAEVRSTEDKTITSTKVRR
ncbi:hypothetical protein Zmor_006372 [Zophobas morio]|uniref:Uncharacterized protein n=1 Tax=Zophobas morio TaxID=2755281 RepID=A0AA38MN16_9CUCU|nr:hypothetical protein Zmor_006372 [Zophobas morio]